MLPLLLSPTPAAMFKRRHALCSFAHSPRQPPWKLATICTLETRHAAPRRLR